MNLLSLIPVDMGNCKVCGQRAELGADGECEECRRGRFRMKSMTEVMDTKSFMLPARRNILWVWTAVTLGLLLLGETVYVLFAGR
jgi:hypothetical protein